HFIENPDTIWFDFLCETIDECWTRLLQAVIERDVKTRIREEAQAWAEQILANDLEKRHQAEGLSRSAYLIANAAPRKNMQLVALSRQGSLLGTTTEKKPPEGKTFVSERLKQFLNRHKPDTIIIINNDQAPVAESVLKMATSGFDPVPQIKYFDPENSEKNASESEWMKSEFDSLLDDNQKNLYGIGLQYIKPLSLIPKIGTSYYSIHPFQNLLPVEKLMKIISRIITQIRLGEGVQVKNIVESVLVQAGIVPENIAKVIKESEKKICTKNDLLKIPDMTEIIFRNMAGFVIIPDAINLLDRTLIHPDYYPLISEISEQLTVSIDTIVRDPEIVHSYNTEDISKKLYIDRKVVEHLSAGSKYISQSAPKVKRKLKLAEVQEGTIVSGTVTNITPFGVFVNINAVCDGLIHISQLADEYVENPDQVVSVNDKVDVKILKVDVKKRRISLSMKGLGNKAPKVRPTKGQLSNLAEFFKNR
ncbi:MAG: S1 RNA-binding domain-containing protein, partial [Fibrobacter sp.]|nr:S1 RNA-binding domain-containing protein [Fibrobacter sp.]